MCWVIYSIIPRGLTTVIKSVRPQPREHLSKNFEWCHMVDIRLCGMTDKLRNFYKSMSRLWSSLSAHSLAELGTMTSDWVPLYIGWYIEVWWCICISINELDLHCLTQGLAACLQRLKHSACNRGEMSSSPLGVCYFALHEILIVSRTVHCWKWVLLC